MKSAIRVVLITLMFLIQGCNIVPKSVEYQKKEFKLIGNIDIVNPVVEEIQIVLESLGYDPGSTDGRMGQKTRDSIKEFQESVGLKGTGYIDNLTLTQIDEIRRANYEKDLKETYKITVKKSSKEPSGTQSFKKPAIKEIQAALKNAGFDPGAIDGKMGQKTRQAIKEFQKTKGLKADGVVGPKTWQELSKYLELKQK